MRTKWYVDRQGRLYDEDGYQYADNICTARYYLDEQQRVCQMGMVIEQHGELLPSGKHKWDYLHEGDTNEID